MSEKTRNETVTAEVFVPAMIAGIKAGKSNKEIAASLNMEVGTFSVRKSQLVKKAKEKAAKDPTYVNPFLTLPKRSRSGADVLGLVDSTFAKLNAADAVVIDPPAEGEKVAEAS